MADRNLSVVLGPRVLGKDAFEAQREQMSKEAGSVGLGPAHDKPFVPQVSAQLKTVKDGPVQAAKAAEPGQPSVPAGKGKGKAPAEPKSGGKGTAGQNVVTFAESDVEKLLTADANLWPKILDAEMKRPEGPRADVAKLLLEHGPTATTEVMPGEIKSQLRMMLGLDPTEE